MTGMQKMADGTFFSQPSPGGQDALVTDAMVESAHAAYWAHPDDSGEDRPCMRAALEAALAARQPVGHVVVTRDENGTIVAVTRQDDEGNILQVIAE